MLDRIITSFIKNPIINYFVVQPHRRDLGKKLMGLGLKHQDMLNESDEDLIVALKRLDPKLVHERNLRIKRAFDLSSKHLYMPHGDEVDPAVWDPYLTEHLEFAKKERLEKSKINSY